MGKLTFNSYQKQARVTAFHLHIGLKVPFLAYLALGLSGEAGEVAEKVKKVYRDHHGELLEEHKELLKLEMGDVLWYLAALSSEMGIGLEEVARANTKKLVSRKLRGTLRGSGDKR